MGAEKQKVAQGQAWKPSKRGLEGRTREVSSDCFVGRVRLVLGGVTGEEDRVSFMCHMPGEGPEWHLKWGQLLSMDSQAQGLGLGQRAGIWLRRPGRRQSRMGLT